MKMVKCSVCGTNTIFDHVSNPQSTRYWKSVRKEPSESLFVIHHNVPSVSKKGKLTTQITKEYVLAVYCSAECGLKDYDSN